MAMKPNIIFIGFVLLTLASCTKTEAVSGVYRGTSSGYTCGTNVEAIVTVTRVDDETVNLDCDFNGLQKHFTNALVFKGNDKYLISHKEGMRAVVRDFEMFFQYENKIFPKKSISFYGTK